MVTVEGPLVNGEIAVTFAVGEQRVPNTELIRIVGEVVMGKP